MSQHGGPGELTIAAVAVLVVSGYALARAGQSGVFGAAIVGVFALALFILGVVWPIVALRGVGVEAAGPRDATVGDEIELRVNLTGRASRIALRPLDPPGEWFRAVAPGSGRLPHTATRRGVFRHVRFELRSAGPLGVLSRRVIVDAKLAAPVEVGPAPVAMRWSPQRLGGASGAASSSPAPGIPDTVRSVRPYTPGDPARLVHWPTSARRGELAVRELEPPAATGLAVILDMSAPEPSRDGAARLGVSTTDAAEAAASRAAGLGRAVLASGGRLLLATHERSGPVAAEVRGVLELSRRLARAMPGLPPPVPDYWPVEVVRA